MQQYANYALDMALRQWFNTCGQATNEGAFMRTRNPDRMRENLAAAEIVLAADEMADIDRRLEEMRPESFGVE